MCPDCEKKFSFKKSLLVLSILTIALVSLESQASGTHGDHGKKNNSKMDHSKMNHGKMDHSKMNHGKMMKNTSNGKKTLNEKAKKEVLSSLAIYEELHKSFFDYDVKGAKEVVAKAKSLSESLNKLSDREIVSSLEKANVFKFLGAIKAGDNRSINNSLLDNISKALNKNIISKYDIGSDYNVFHCPMVDKHWIQNTTKMAKVHNPYAPEMPHCGGKL